MHGLQSSYFNSYRSLNLERDAKGVLLAKLHSNGAPELSRHKITLNSSMLLADCVRSSEQDHNPDGTAMARDHRRTNKLFLLHADAQSPEY
jgi:hypothetical protein